KSRPAYRNTDSRRLAFDPRLFGRIGRAEDGTSGYESRAAFVFARKEIDRVGGGDLLSAVHRFLIRKVKYAGLRVGDLRLDRVRLSARSSRFSAAHWRVSDGRRLADAVLVGPGGCLPVLSVESADLDGGQVQSVDATHVECPAARVETRADTQADSQLLDRVGTPRLCT